MKLNYLFLTLFTFAIFSCTQNNKQEGAQTKDSVASAVEAPQQEPTPQPAIASSEPLPAADVIPIEFSKQLIKLASGDSFALAVPKGFVVTPVAWGMQRIRFMDTAPNGRLFLTDMFNLSDNSKGKVYILDDFNDSTLTFNKRITYLENLRNPNSLAFHTDANGKEWLYLALTDKLLRYPYERGSEKPTAAPEVLDTYPDYGLSYRYGGWHLTRTICFGSNGKLYVSVGSSCNSCVEKEEVRASVVEMDADGKNKKYFAHGIRNAVGLAWAEGGLYATCMAADHLGKEQPDDVLVKVEDGQNYGWPYCYYWNGKIYNDPLYDTVKTKITADKVHPAFSYLGAHIAPLGLAWFGEQHADDAALKNYFIVAEHGSYSPAIGRGYNLQRVRENAAPEDFITGFQDENKKVHGRPCGVYPIGKDRFYFTDDKFGVLYLVYKKE